MATTKAAVESSKVVKYIGTADLRSISAAEWKQAGVEDQGKVTWDKSNKWQVPVSELTAAALKYCDEDDAGFVITDVSVD